jgi:hypothetical protein
MIGQIDRMFKKTGVLRRNTGDVLNAGINSSQPKYALLYKVTLCHACIIELVGRDPSTPRTIKSEQYLSFPQPQNLSQEFLEAQRDVAIPVIVVALENVRHAFQADASLGKQVEAHALPASTYSASVIVRVIEHSCKWMTKPVAKCQQSLTEFL